jgi:hypothetical protein
MSGTNGLHFRRILWPAVLMATACLAGCRDTTAPVIATLTFKNDGSHFTGTVVRREPNSITITGAQGDTHTFLYSELIDIKIGAPDTPTPPARVDSQESASSASSSSGFGAGSSVSAVAAANAANKSSTARANAVASVSSSGEILFPVGTEFPVRTMGFLDSCCVPVDGLSLGTIDDDIRNASGKVIIPVGANVTVHLLEKKKVDGRMTMNFELASADFGGRHYVISSTKGALEPGAAVRFTGAEDGSPEAKLRGLNVHLDDQSYMGFKAETPVVFKLSQ